MSSTAVILTVPPQGRGMDRPSEPPRLARARACLIRSPAVPFIFTGAEMDGVGVAAGS